MKTIQRVRAERKAERQRLNDEAYQRRLKARELLFGKGNGSSKNLTPAEALYVRSVWKEAYELYLAEFLTGEWVKPYNFFRTRRVNLNKANPVSPRKHRRSWYASQKKRWIHHDLPEMMKKRMEESGGTPTVSELHP